MVTVPGPPDCQIPPESPTRGISGRTYEQKIPRFDTQGHNPNRVTITVSGTIIRHPFQLSTEPSN
jgi:hypothetical protein